MSSPHDDLEPLDDLEPMDELEPLDDLEPVEELDALEPVEEAPAVQPETPAPSAEKAEEPAPAAAPTGAPEAAVPTGAPEAAVPTGAPEAAVPSGAPEAAVSSSAPEAAAAAAAPAEAGARRKRGEELGSQKRELEQAPLELRKAAQVLTIGALFPFYYGVKFAVTAIQPEGNLDGFAQWAEGSGAFPFAAFFLAKALAMAGGWLQLEGYKGAAGEVTKGIGLTLGKAHKLAPIGAAAVLWILALLIPMGALGLSVSNSYLTVGGVDGVLGGGLIAVELLALILAQATLAHIYAYEHGGKFNPIFPLMFLGPALAGVLQLVNVARIGSSNDPAWGWLGLLGSGVCAAGGIMAMNVMMKAMKEAKAEGERKAEIIRQQRKAEREAKRASRQKK